MHISSTFARIEIVLGLLASAAFASCVSDRQETATRSEIERPDAAAFASESWDDGLAVVSVFRGRVKRYGAWRAAEVREYLVREALSPSDLTKRDAPTAADLAVLKVNRRTSFETGSYGYEFMSSLWFLRSDGSLLKGRGACLNACGMVTQGWDALGEELRSDSYWEGEGARSLALPADPTEWRYADELPYLALSLPDGFTLGVLPPLAAPHAMLSAGANASADVTKYDVASIGIGDLCLECVGLGDVERARSNETSVLPSPLRLQVEAPRPRAAGARVVRFRDEGGVVVVEYRFDQDGFLLGWTLPDEQEFSRVRRIESAYWEATSERDRRRFSAY